MHAHLIWPLPNLSPSQVIGYPWGFASNLQVHTSTLPTSLAQGGREGQGQTEGTVHWSSYQQDLSQNPTLLGDTIVMDSPPTDCGRQEEAALAIKAQSQPSMAQGHPHGLLSKHLGCGDPTHHFPSSGCFSSPCPHQPPHGPPPDTQDSSQKGEVLPISVPNQQSFLFTPLIEQPLLHSNPTVTSQSPSPSGISPEVASASQRTASCHTEPALEHWPLLLLTAGACHTGTPPPSSRGCDALTCLPPGILCPSNKP